MLQSCTRSNLEAGINENSERADGEPITRRMYQLYQGEGKRDFVEAAVNKALCHCCQTMKYCWIYDTFSLKLCIGIGDGHRDSHVENDASGSVKSDTVAGTFKQHRKVQWSMEFRLNVCLLSMATFAVALPHGFVDTEEHCLQLQYRLYYVPSQVAMHQEVDGCYRS